jgi:hypothetical protein
MRHRGRSSLVLGTAALVLLLCGIVPSAVAQPEREDVPLAAFTLEDICAFDVFIEPLTNREIQTTFFDRAGEPRLFLVTGALKLRLTNVDTGKSIDVNAPGPGRFIPQDDGLTQVTEGPWVLFFPAGTFPGTPDAQLLFVRGRTVTEFDAAGNPTLISLRGYVEDLCAALADP